MPIDNVEEMVMSEDEAEETYKEYARAVKERKEEYLKDLKKVYYALSKGKKIINIFESFKSAGLNDKGEPKLTISVASEKKVRFVKQARGSGTYYNNSLSERFNVELPSETWKNWETEDVTEPKTWKNDYKNKVLETIVPITPAHLLPKGNLKGYYILWEPSEWKNLPQKKDPFLLKRISNNLFVVLAEWEVSAIEQAAVHGSLVK